MIEPRRVVVADIGVMSPHGIKVEHVCRLQRSQRLRDLRAIQVPFVYRADTTFII
jgi:hypothetical protein